VIALVFRLLFHGRSISTPVSHVARVPRTADMRLPNAKEGTVKNVAKYVPG